MEGVAIKGAALHIMHFPEISGMRQIYILGRSRVRYGVSGGIPISPYYIILRPPRALVTLMFPFPPTAPDYRNAGRRAGLPISYNMHVFPDRLRELT